VEVKIERRVLRLRQPLTAAYGTIAEREILCVRLTGEDGVSGFGEAAPLPSYDGVSVQRTLRALERHRAAIAELTATPQPGAAGRAPSRSVADGGAEASRTGATLLDACRAADPLPQALAAIDIALWDLAGTREGRPVAALLVEDPAPAVSVNATLSATDRASAAAQAAEAVQRGFACIKVKVGIGDDAGRVAAVRAAAGPDVALRLDANGAWDVEQAVRAIETLAPCGLELVEEPTHGIEAVRRVRERVPTRVAIDETAAEHGALASGAADAVCLKISRCGGISGLLAAAALVRASGAEPYLASTLDGPLGIAAALHAAAALAARGPLPPCGLATLSLFEGLAERLPIHEGQIVVPRAPGLGVKPI
jgi:L-Ala-D/L-Glu epimerase